MKKLIVTILVFMPIYITAQWEIIHQNKWEFFTSLKLYDDSLGFATANNGQIIKTTDGGLNWENHIRLEGELEELQFVDKNHWWLTSTKADTIKRLYRSTDGGDTWEELAYDISHMNFIQFVGKEKGWAEQSGKLYFTLDGGYSWIAKSANISNICQLSFYDENIGWIFDGVLRKTIDGGNTWETFNYSEIEKIRTISESICYFQKGIEIYWTTNGGKYWKNIHPLDFTGLRGGIGIQWDCISETSIYIYVGSHSDYGLFLGSINRIENMEESLRIGAKIIDFSGKLHGCIATENSILTTTDFGNNWQLSVHGLNQLINMDFLNSKDGYIIAKDWMLQNHFLLKTSDGGENWLNVNLPDSLDQGWQGLNSTCFVEENIGFIGADNKIYKTIDGGNNWYESILEVKRSYYPIDVIYFYDKQHGWAISGQENTSFIYSTNDYGETWEMVSLNDSSFYNDIVFINSEIGFIVGVEKLYKTINGGVDWECNNLEGYWFNDIEQITPSLGYVCGYYYSNGGQIMNNFIYCSNDGWEDQTNWIKQLKVKNSKFNSIEMIDSLVGFVCGFIIDDNYQINGIIYHTSDGGKNWEENYTIVGSEINDIQFIDENTGWAAGENGIVLRTTNGGVTWVDNEQDKIPNKVMLHQNYPNPFNPSTTIKYSIPSSSVILSLPSRQAGGAKNLKDFSSQTSPKNGAPQNDNLNVSLKVYDILGREVATLVNQTQKPGNYEVEFDGAELTSGIYFYRLQAGDPESSSGEVFREIKKMILLK